jgi:hypothetical protein
MARLQLGSSLNPETIREGTDVYFDCLIQARPTVYKVEWRHNVSMSVIENMAAQLLGKFQALYRTQEPATGLSLEPDESSPRPAIIFT